MREAVPPPAYIHGAVLSYAQGELHLLPLPAVNFIGLHTLWTILCYVTGNVTASFGTQMNVKELLWYRRLKIRDLPNRKCTSYACIENSWRNCISCENSWRNYISCGNSWRNCVSCENSWRNCISCENSWRNYISCENSWRNCILCVTNYCILVKGFRHLIYFCCIHK
jgi:hypothetical protein